MADNNNAKRLLCILEILRKHSDSRHPLSQQDIIRMLRDLYGIKADRKTVKSNILSLIDYGYDIEFTETVREKGTSKENTIASEYYINNEFTDSELRLLIDSVLYSPNISADLSKKLINKLQNQSGEYFKTYTKHIACMPSRKSENKQLFLTIELLDEAISQKNKISFKHLHYGTDLQLHVDKGFNVRTETLGSEIQWRVSPYQMVMCEGKYYLICSHVHNKIIHIPLSEMFEVKILNEKAQPYNTLTDSDGQPLNLKEYMKEHIFMCSGTPVRARLRILNEMFFHVITDTFGTDVTVINPDSGGRIDVEVKAPASAIISFAMKHMGEVLVLEPEDIADDVMRIMERTYRRYKRLSREYKNQQK